MHFTACASVSIQIYSMIFANQDLISIIGMHFIKCIISQQKKLEVVFFVYQNINSIIGMHLKKCTVGRQK